MGKIIKFYIKQNTTFLKILFGIYIIFNLINFMMGIMYEKVFYRGGALSTFITGVVLFIYLIKVNLYDTGRETFTLVSMTGNSQTKILLSKLMVIIITLAIYVCLVLLFMFIGGSLSGRDMNFLFFSRAFIRIIFILIILICYISYPIIWIKSFKIEKLLGKIIALGIIIIWFITNGILRNSELFVVNYTIENSGHFGHGYSTIWSIFWHLTWAIIFLLFTIYLQNKKIDSI